MEKTNEPLILGFNQAGIEKSRELFKEFFLVVGVLFGLLMMIASVWFGAIIMAGFITLIVRFDKHKKYI